MFPTLRFGKTLVENTRLPADSYSQEGVHNTTRFQPLASYGDSFYFLNNQHNWTNAFLWQQVARNIKITDLDAVQAIQNLSLENDTLSSLQNLSKPLSSDFKDVKESISKLSTINQQILDTLKLTLNNKIGNPPSIGERFSTISDRIDKLEAMLNKMSGVLILPEEEASSSKRPRT